MIKRLQEIRERVEKAAEGPWEVDEEMVYLPGDEVLVRYAEGKAVRGKYFCQCDGGTTHEQDEADASFIAHAREDIPFLLAENDRLREVEKAAKECREAHKEYFLTRGDCGMTRTSSAYESLAAIIDKSLLGGKDADKG